MATYSSHRLIIGKVEMLSQTLLFDILIPYSLYEGPSIIVKMDSYHRGCNYCQLNVAIYSVNCKMDV